VLRQGVAAWSLLLSPSWATSAHAEGCKATFGVGIANSKERLRIGSLIAMDTIHEWIPRDPYKAVVCGNIDHVGFFHTVTAEYDWDIYVSPDKEHLAFADDPASEPCAGGDVPGAKKCISGEVTAPPELRVKNPWFDWSHQTSSLIDREVCIYGPWVSDDAHGSRPEIHPVNAIWWRNEQFDETWLVVLQDASGRYVRTDAFRGPRHGASTAWIPTKEDLCISVEPEKTYRVEAFSQGSTAWSKGIFGGQPSSTEQVLSDGDRSLTVARTQADALQLALNWSVPRCSYCGDEKYLVVRVTPDLPPRPAATLEPAPPVMAARIVETPIGAASHAPASDVWREFGSMLGLQVAEGESWNSSLRQVREWQLDVEDVFRTSVREWSVEWSVDGSRMQGEGSGAIKREGRIRIPVLHSGSLSTRAVSASVRKPNTSEPERILREVANVGLLVSPASLLRLLDEYVPLPEGEKWASVDKPGDPGPAGFRRRAVLRLVHGFPKNSIQGLETLKALVSAAKKAGEQR
jgi:hypothetical protein